jgi:ribulose-phosphate 3-epimerase
MSIKILPSLLAADIGNLEAGVRQAEETGGDALHLDIMDGVFVPNVSMGPAVVAMANRCTDLFLDVHLMMIHPDQHVDPFIEAGADAILIHIESDCDVPGTLRHIREKGVRPGITLNPATPSDSIQDVAELVDEILCMTVNPGYGGQTFMSEVLPKMGEVREMATRAGRPDMDIMVDGGVDRDTIAACAEQGVNAFVAGTALYSADDMGAEVSLLRERATAAAR